MASLVDTHCHLDFEAFDEDREAVLVRSREAGVDRWINPGVDVASSQKAIYLAEQYPGVFAAVGFHPTEDDHGLPQEIAAVRELASHSKVVAIGEIGLDHYHKNVPVEVQVPRFRAHLNLAAELGLPVIIHSRDAISEVLDELENWVGQLRKQGIFLANHPGVLHAFEGKLADARRANDLGFMVGVGGPLTYLNAPDRRELFASLPLEHLLTETDAPFLTPHPYRGKRNEPAYIRLIAERLAEIQGTSLENVVTITSQNADRLFAWRHTD